jgi:hypothetical protein
MPQNSAIDAHVSPAAAVMENVQARLVRGEREYAVEARTSPPMSLTISMVM